MLLGLAGYCIGGTPGSIAATAVRAVTVVGRRRETAWWRLKSA
ncbi:hypothetical protein ACFFX1_06265 [Dactylosporangium sucinum]|nr:hypothetical protein [Dactylosporangium sucinum]